MFERPTFRIIIGMYSPEFLRFAKFRILRRDAAFSFDSSQAPTQRLTGTFDYLKIRAPPAYLSWRHNGFEAQTELQPP